MGPTLQKRGGNRELKADAFDPESSDEDDKGSKTTLFCSLISARLSYSHKSDLLR